jgi:hypothetical protein
MKLVRLIKMCLTEKYNNVRLGKHLSDMFPIRNGLKKDAISPLFFNFALEYVIRRVPVNQKGLKLYGTYQFLFYVDDVNILGGSVHTVKVNAEALLVASKEIGLEISAYKSEYMVMSGDQNAGRSHILKNDKTFFERMEEFRYLETTLTNQNSVQEEIKSRLKTGNVCYHSVQKLLSSSLLSKNIKIKIYRTIISPVVLYGCVTLSLTLREGRRLRMFENKMLRRIFRPKRDG